MSSLSEGVFRGSRVAVFVLGLISMAAGIPLFAQLPTGTILGTVKDASGAVIPGAMVTAQDVETGVVRSIATDDTGGYRFNALPVSHYDITVKASGFSSSTQRGLVLNVDQQAVVNFSLQVGTTAQQVVVTGEAPLVNTTSASLGGLVNEQRIQNLPLNGRNYLDLTLLQPGVSQDTVMINAGGGTQGTIFSSNGAPIIANNFLLDGAPLQNLFGFNGASAVGSSLGLDGIREYKVITSNFPAEYGLRMGSQMTIVSKGGSDQFHGDVFEYLRNRVLDARNFFESNQELCPSTPTSCPRSPQYERNNFGGAFGGPIRKGKTFFWGVYEGLRQAQGNPVITSGLPACMVSQGTSAATNYTVNPATCAGTGLTTPTQVNAAIRPLLALYDPADTDYIQVAQENVNYGQIRVDQNFNKDDSMFVRYTIEGSSELVPGPGYATTYGFKEFEDSETSRDQYITLSESHIFSPTVLNTARISFSRTNIPTAIVANPAQDGQAVQGPNVSYLNGQPMGQIIIGNGFSAYNAPYTTMGPDPYSPNFHLQNWWSLGDDLFYTKGSHALQFGFMGNRVQIIDEEDGGTYGSVSFPTVPDFLENIAQQETGVIPGGIDRRHYVYNTFGFYGQDDWRVSPRLTVNLGLRYEFNTTPTETDNLSGNYANSPYGSGFYDGLQTTVLNPGATVSTVGGPNWTNPLVHESFVSNPSLKNFSPRIGLAFDPTGSGKTAIRAGYGIYYDVATIGLAAFPYTNGDPPYHGSYTLSSTAPFGAPNLTFAPGFISNSGYWTYPFNGLIYPGATNSYQGLSPNNSLGLPVHDISQPYMMQWNLSVDRQLPGNMALTVSYVGTRGYNLWDVQDENPCLPTGFVNGVPNWANAANSSCPSTNAYFPTGHTCTVISPLTGTTILSTTDGRADCDMKQSLSAQTSGRSWYNALQVLLQKRVSHGLEFQSSYTYSSNIDTEQGQGAIDEEINTPYVSENYDRGRDPLNATNNWRFNTLYAFPTTSKAEGWKSKLLNGWSTQSIVAVQSGFAFTPVAPSSIQASPFAAPVDPELDGLGQEGGYERPDYVTAANIADVQTCTAGPGSLTPHGRLCNPNAVIYNPSTVITGNPNAWYNANMYTTAPLGYLGGVGRGSLVGPSFLDWDFSLHKDTKLGFLGEAGVLQFRVEFFDILNHPNFLVNPPGNVNNVIAAPFTNVIGTTSCQPGLPCSGSGALQNAMNGRDIQFALRVVF